MKQLDINAEWMALVTLTCSPSVTVRSLLLGRLTSGHFKYEVTHPLFAIIAELAVNTGSIPSIQLLHSVPGVSATALQALAGFASSYRPIDNEDDARGLLHVLTMYRRGRLLFDFVNTTQSELEGEVADFAKLREGMEKLLVNFQDEQEESKLWHLGHSRNANELFIKATSKERVPGIKTGLRGFDMSSPGFQRGNLVGMAAPYKSGKSIIAYNIAMNQYRMGYNVLYIPLEMNDEEAFDRHLASIAKVEHKKIVESTCSNAELKQLTRAYEAFNAEGEQRKNRFSMQALSTITPSGLEARFKAFRYDIIFVDYLSLMECPGQDRMSEPERLNTLGRLLKAVAGRMNCVVVVLAQLDEGTKDLRYSKALKEHANNIWKWSFGEVERTQGLITVDQICARSWEPFQFQLKPNFAMSSVEDASDGMASVIASQFAAPSGEDMLGGWK